MTGALFDLEPEPAFDWSAYHERIRQANEARQRAIADRRRQPKSDAHWSQEADWWLKTLTTRGETITADDLIREIGLPTGSPNQVGARFTKWHKAGLIEPAGYTQSTRKESNGRAVRVWRVTK